MPTNNQPLDPFQIAALAGFAKNCNLINSQQFEKIINSGAKRLDPSIFVVQEVPDWIFYDKVGFQGFKTAIEGVVFNSFFRLMQKDSVFAAKMARNILKLGTGLLNAESFKQLIVDEIGDVINNIAVRISNGEQLTGAEIEQLIEGGIKSKENELESGGKKLENPDPTEPTGSNTFFPDLALQQKTKGLRWRPIKGASISPKQLQRVKKSTENIKKQLEKTKSSLRTAKSIVALLKKLESVYSNGLIGIVQSVLKIVFSFVRDIGSSGVYMLDMVGPYTHIDLTRILDDTEKTKRSERMGELLRRKIQKENIGSTYAYMNNDLVNSTPFVSDWVIPPKERIVADRYADNLSDAEEILSTIYKPTTYASFIQTIADAFLDDGDVASYGWNPNGIKFGEKYIMPKPDPEITRKRTERGIISGIANVFEGSADTLRVGRPDFGKGSSVNVTIVAFSIPNIINVLTLFSGGLRSILMLLSFFKQKFYHEEAGNFLKANHPFMKRINRALSKSRNTFGKVTSNKFYDYYDNKPEVEVQTDNKGEKIESITVNAGLTSQDPDFYGVAVRNIFSGFFRSLDKLEAISSELLKNFKSSLSKELENLLKNIEEFIDDLEDFIDILDSIISFFETLQTMGLYTLNFTSNGGTSDIVEKLLAAENFPGVTEGDKLRLIGGMVFCYGGANPDPSKIDFSGLIKQKMAAVNYEAALAKFESSGDSDNDPGSFDDYLNSEGIGNSYTSSLDKIFKKLF
jgi:molecular chaperone GrpE (heat shock protein)